MLVHLTGFEVGGVLLNGFAINARDVVLPDASLGCSIDFVDFGADELAFPVFDAVDSS